MCTYTCVVVFFFFFKQKTAYEMRISDWSSDVCSSDLLFAAVQRVLHRLCGRKAELARSGDLHRRARGRVAAFTRRLVLNLELAKARQRHFRAALGGVHDRLENRVHGLLGFCLGQAAFAGDTIGEFRSEEQTSDLQSLM